MQKKPSLFHLFMIFFKLGLFTFGGGYAMIPLMEKELVTDRSLVNEGQFYEYIALAQSSPGPIAVNLSVLIGNQMGGLIYSIMTVLGVVLPSLLVIMIISVIYTYTRNLKIMSGFFMGVGPVIPALLLVSFYKMFKQVNRKPLLIFILIASFLAVAVFSINPFWLVLGGGVFGLCMHYLGFTSFLH